MDNVNVPGFERFLEAFKQLTAEDLIANSSLFSTNMNPQELADKMTIDASGDQTFNDRETVHLTVTIPFDSEYADMGYDTDDIDQNAPFDSASTDNVWLEGQDHYEKEIADVFGESGYINDSDTLEDFGFEDVAGKYSTIVKDVNIDVSGVEGYITYERTTRDYSGGYSAEYSGEGTITVELDVIHTLERENEDFNYYDYDPEYDEENPCYNCDDDEDHLCPLESKNFIDETGRECELRFCVDDMSGIYSVQICCDGNCRCVYDGIDHDSVYDMFETYALQEYDPETEFMGNDAVARQNPGYGPKNEAVEEGQFVVQHNYGYKFVAPDMNVGSFGRAARFNTIEEAESFMNQDDPKQIWRRYYEVVNIADI